jgi:DinB superfamily
MKKRISTELTQANIVKVIGLLTEAPQAAQRLCEGLTEAQCRQPLAAGERSVTEVVAHLLNCEARTSEAVYLALLVDEPLLADIHPEREWGHLLRLSHYPMSELLSYFRFRRTVLLGVLKALTPLQWSRSVRQREKQRKESVYWQARSLALHEHEHLLDIETRLSNRHAR